jgi:hypothetical protein
MKMPLPLLDQEFIYPKELGDFCDFLSFLQDHRNRLLIESIVVVSLESHVGSFNGRFRPLYSFGNKKPPKNSPSEDRISSKFWPSLNGVVYVVKHE